MKKIISIIAIAFTINCYAQEGLTVVKPSASVSTKVVYSELYMHRTKEGVNSVKVVFVQYDLSGNFIQELYYEKSKTEFNEWWKNFTSGKFLYSQLALKDANGNSVSVSDSVESDFVNPN